MGFVGVGRGRKLGAAIISNSDAKTCQTDNDGRCFER